MGLVVGGEGEFDLLKGVDFYIFLRFEDLNFHSLRFEESICDFLTFEKNGFFLPEILRG